MSSPAGSFKFHKQKLPEALPERESSGIACLKLLWFLTWVSLALPFRFVSVMLEPCQSPWMLGPRDPLLHRV